MTFPMTSLPLHREPTPEQLEEASTEFELKTQRGTKHLSFEARFNDGEPWAELVLSGPDRTMWANLSFEKAEMLHTALGKFLDLG